MKQEEWFEVHDTPLTIKIPSINCNKPDEPDQESGGYDGHDGNERLSRQSTRNGPGASTIPLGIEIDVEVNDGIVMEDGGDGDGCGVSLSYAWIVMILSKFIGELDV